MSTRYVITHVDRDGERRMTHAMQGRFTFSTPKQAEELLDALIAQSPANRIAEAYGEQAVNTFEVRPVECYEGHHDPKTMWFD